MTAPTQQSSAATLASLDAAHRAQQAANSERVAQLVLGYWLTRVDGEDLAGTSGDWLDFSVTQILRGYDRAYMLASAYTQAIQRQQAPGAPRIEVSRPTPPPVQKLRRSLSYTGPGTVAVELKKAPEDLAPAPDASPQEREAAERGQVNRADRVKIIMQKAGAAAAATTYKNVGNGGRDTVDLLVVRKQVVGYARITKEKPCGFCLMLASRGPVYSEDSFARSDARFSGPGEHKVHDTCGCMLRPLFSRMPENWTEQNRTADNLWGDMLKANPGIGGKDAVNAFRRMAREAGLADLTRY